MQSTAGVEGSGVDICISGVVIGGVDICICIISGLDGGGVDFDVTCVVDDGDNGAYAKFSGELCLLNFGGEGVLLDNDDDKADE